MRLNAFGGRTGLKALVAVTGLAFAAACQDEEPVLSVSEVAEESVAAMSIEVSSLSAAAGETITVGVAVDADEVLGGAQGHLRWNPDHLRFAGQIPEGRTMVVTNLSEMERGAIHLVSVDTDGFQGRVAAFAFEVLSPAYTSSIRFDADVLVAMDHRVIEVAPATFVSRNTDLPQARDAQVMTVRDWAERLDPGVLGASDELPRIAGAADVYGDGNTDGAVNVLDVGYTANVAVGNTTNAECIIGSATSSADCVAVNVAPANDGAAGPCFPGFESCGSHPSGRVVNVQDVLPIAIEAVGTDQPVVGESIQNFGGQDRDFSTLPVVTLISDTIPGNELVINGTRVFSADTLYQLRGGQLLVGGRGGGAGEVVFEPGVRFEGDSDAALIITRQGRIIADGTPNAPITFTCVDDGAGRFPGCWGGVFIAGNAVINDQDAGLGPAPDLSTEAPGRNDGGGGFQKVGEGGAVNYGGNNDADSSGVLRYARFLYGGSELAPNNELNNLSIGACGSGTVIENIQVHAGLDDGFELFGGRCDVKNIYATSNDDDQFDYSFGYDGTAQFLVIQQLGEGDKGFEVDNTEDTATFANQPRTGPFVYNTTLVNSLALDTAGNRTNGAIRYRRGAGGVLRNFLVVGYNDGFDPEETSCDLLPTEGTAPGYTGTRPNVLTLENVVFLSVDDAGDGGNGCTDAQSEGYLNSLTTVLGGDDLTNPDAGRSYAGELRAPFDPLAPDFRPVGNGLFGLTGAAAPCPTCEATTYVGGVPPVGAGGVIPFYLGWTVGWQTTTTR